MEEHVLSVFNSFGGNRLLPQQLKAINLGRRHLILFFCKEYLKLVKEILIETVLHSAHVPPVTDQNIAII